MSTRLAAKFGLGPCPEIVEDQLPSEKPAM
jgi:hypothetical protein